MVPRLQMATQKFERARVFLRLVVVLYGQLRQKSWPQISVLIHTVCRCCLVYLVCFHERGFCFLVLEVIGFQKKMEKIHLKFYLCLVICLWDFIYKSFSILCFPRSWINILFCPGLDNPIKVIKCTVDLKKWSHKSNWYFYPKYIFYMYSFHTFLFLQVQNKITKCSQSFGFKWIHNQKSLMNKCFVSFLDN